RIPPRRSRRHAPLGLSVGLAVRRRLAALIRGTTRTQNQDERVDFVFSSISVRRVRLRILDEQPDERGAFYRASVMEIEGYGR
ncbi:MAG: hypothetical protein VX815_11865, partial [Gemmatimonadota bacterium]|nr:hypothetical protein [Gemmatimonadota bacterium]